MNPETQINLPLHPHDPVDPSMARALSHYNAEHIKGVLSVVEDKEPEIPSASADELEWELKGERMSVCTKVPTNLCKWLEGDWSCESDDANFKPDRDTAASACSPSALEQVLARNEDIEKANSRVLRRVKVPRNRLVPIVHQLAKIYPCSSIQMSGFFLYPDGGYMGWHTNSDAPCTRVYITHAKEGGISFFRYRLDGEYVTSWDKPGWNLRQFGVAKESPLWHCVYSEEPRLSIGFRINRNLL